MEELNRPDRWMIYFLYELFIKNNSTKNFYRSERSIKFRSSTVRGGIIINSILLGLLDFFGSELAIFTELFNPQGAWGFPEPTTADPLLVQFFLSSIAPIKPADV